MSAPWGWDRAAAAYEDVYAAVVGD
jgi:hypothetical protein